MKTISNYMYFKSAIYNRLIKLLSEIHPTKEHIIQVLLNSCINAGSVNMQGSAEWIWDSVLAYAEVHDQTDLLLKESFEGIQREEVDRILHEIASGEAYLELGSYEKFQRKNDTASKPNIFIIRAAQDQDDLQGLMLQLNIGKLAGLYHIEYLSDPGDMITDSLLGKIAKAAVVLAIISPGFFADDHCLMLTFGAFDMQKRVVPVLLSPCPYARIDILKNIQPLPLDQSFILSPVSEKDNKEYETTEEIIKLIQKLQPRP